MSTPFKILNTTSLPDSEAQIEVELSVEAVSKFRDKAIANLQDAVSLPGFRKGHVPEKMLVEKVGEISVLEETVELALPEYYFDIIKESKLNIIGRPQVAITTLAPNNPVVLKITIAVVPEVTLPDFKKIAAAIAEKKAEVAVDDKEVDEAVLEIRRRLKTPEDIKEGDQLPELTDELVKQIGDFKDVEEFKNKLRDSILKEKEVRERDKKRLEIMDAILKETKTELPKVLVENELDRMLAQFEDNIVNMGLNKEEYFKQVGKTEADLRTDWKDEAAKRARTQLVLNTISLQEKIMPDTEEVKKETAHLLEHYKDIDPLRAESYIETMLLNEKVWQFLENQK